MKYIVLFQHLQLKNIGLVLLCSFMFSNLLYSQSTREVINFDHGWLRDDIWQHHNQIQINDFDFYDVNIFNRCENGNEILMAIEAWSVVHPLLKIFPVDWDHSIPYGLLHSPQPSPTVKKFLDAIRKVIQQDKE